MCIKLHQCTTAKWHLQWAGPSCSVAPVVDKQLYPESVIIPRIRPQILCRVMPLNYRKNQVGSECAAKLSLCMSIILPPGNSPCRLQGQGFPPPHTRLPSELTSWSVRQGQPETLHLGSSCCFHLYFPASIYYVPFLVGKQGSWST